MRYIKRDLEPTNGIVRVFYEDTMELLFECDPYIADTIIYTWNNQKKILSGRFTEHKKQEVFQCNVCGAGFTDPFEHMESAPNKEKHIAYIERVKQSGYTIDCFCGSPVKFYEYMGGGFDRSCDSCKMVYDQDAQRKQVQDKLWSTQPEVTGDTIKVLSDPMMDRSLLTPKPYSMSGVSL